MTTDDPQYRERKTLEPREEVTCVPGEEETDDKHTLDHGNSWRRLPSTSL